MNLFRKLYCIYDRLADSSGPIFEAPNDSVAKRMFGNLMKENMQVPPEQIFLFCVGEFKSPTEIIAIIGDNLIISGAELIIEETK